MATYENPRGNVNGTADADTFLFNTPLDSLTVADALAGVDQLIVDRSADQGSSFRAGDIFHSGTFYGGVQTGPYDPQLIFYQFEDVRIRRIGLQ